MSFPSSTSLWHWGLKLTAALHHMDKSTTEKYQRTRDQLSTTISVFSPYTKACNFWSSRKKLHQDKHIIFMAVAWAIEPMTLAGKINSAFKYKVHFVFNFQPQNQNLQHLKTCNSFAYFSHTQTAVLMHPSSLSLWNFPPFHTLYAHLLHL